MTLIRSISGIRGTIGGRPEKGLTPPDVVKYTAAFGQIMLEESESGNPAIVIGRDARPSGPMVKQLVVATLNGMGIDVIDLDLATTPTVEMAVVGENAIGGIILTASHNPKEWNALKLLNAQGEFINAQQGEEVLHRAAMNDMEFCDVDDLGTIESRTNWLDRHIQAILDLDTVDVELVSAARLKVVVDGVNSVGGIAVPALLKRLNVECVELYCEPTGQFPHNPEPLPEHLKDLSEQVVHHGAHAGISVDPDVDRLALVCEDGSMFGEEYTLVACADHVLSTRQGNTVSNLSSTRALRDVTESHGGEHFASAVGEVNVVAKMKEVNAVIGGEGNGGVIVPELHYGRDALAGIALFLTKLASSGLKTSELRATYPDYHISKNKIRLEPGMDVDGILKELESRFADEPKSTVDGLKIELGNEWVHLRKSNTEPIIRIYSESRDKESADGLAKRFMGEIEEVAGISE
jgi:phosphomannomutase